MLHYQKPVHPLIAHFLDAAAVRSALKKADAGEPLDPKEGSFARAANAHPEQRTLLAGSTKSLESQRAALAVSVFAALEDLRKDETLGPKAIAAVQALKAAGASGEETDHQLAMVLFEEAFAFDSDPAHFDQAFVAESLDSLKGLAQLDEAMVEELTEAFAAQAPRPERPLWLKVAEALFAAAWSEGPMLVSAEAVEEAMEGLREGSQQDLEPVLKAMLALFKLLESRELMGPERVDRLTDAARRAALGGSEDEDEDDAD